MFKILILISFVVLSFGINLPKIKDISTIPQNFESYAVDQNSSFQKYHDEFVQKYYNPWDADSNISNYTFAFGAKYISGKNHFGDNKQEISQSFKDKLVENTHIIAFPSMSKNAITIRNTDCRLLPTSKPFFTDFKKDGGGYPFDYLQNSMIHINTPIKVLHYSKDRAFAYIKSPYVAGWINSSDLAFVSNEDINKTRSMKLVTPKNDDITILEGNNFISKAFIGAVFWQDNQNNTYLFKTNEHAVGILTNIKSTIDSNTSSESAFQVIPQIPNKINFTNIASKLYGQNYGWGGFLQNRDCSMMIRDFYTPFGLFLPRNSFDQANDKKDEVISLESKTRDEKIKIIKDNALPFATLFYMKGHIMMYVGTHDDQIVIFHSIWSVKTLNKGRFVIGGSFVTSLNPGIDLPDFDHESGTLLDKLVSMRILGTK